MEAMATTVPDAALGSRATPLQKAFIRELLLGQTVDGYAALCSTVATSNVGRLSDVKAKVLIVLGSEDKSAPMEGSLKYNTALGELSSVAVLEGVGHWHVIEAAEEVSGLVDGFVEGL